MEERSRSVEPFKTLEDLYLKVNNLVAWPPTEPLRACANYVFRGSQIDDDNQQLQKLQRDHQPKTLICHDMMGGYLEDRFIEGTDTNDAYLFYHWNHIDTFIYFSHHLITIPPYGWIQAAHRHGVKILGTIITEHKEGEGVWIQVLRSRETVHEFADALVKLTKFYNFDGWLLNVENPIDNVSMLTYFVKHFTDRMHQEISHSEVIWYDSVTTTGSLAWQNKLNDANETFFNACDGIFLNYNWTEEGLIESCERAKRGNRITDVYVGLDVWGRRCPGGGGFNSAYALQIIRRMGLSVAIFAQGWTHQFFGSRTFHEVERIYWAQLIPMLYVHIPLYINELFVSSFGRGIGLKEYRCGELSRESPFFNLAKQHIQPCMPFVHSKFNRGFTVHKNEEGSETIHEHVYETTKEIMKVIGKTISFEPKATFLGSANHVCHSQEFAYNGGESLKFIINDKRVYHRLFLVQIDSYTEVQGVIVFRHDIRDVRGSLMQPVLVLGNDDGNRIITPRETTNLQSGWRKSVFYTDLRTFYEIGVAFSALGSCYLGEIVIERRSFFSESTATCLSENLTLDK